MLQQTRVEAAIPYYRRFLAAFPTVFDLANAQEEAVLKNWEGLGYYTRARNLHRAAKIVAGELAGQFPRTAKGLRALPGIGAYTAGAIASIAFGEAETAIDGNQIRVLTRLFAIEGETGKPGTAAEIRKAARALLDPDRPGDFNQALMGMGALVCLPKNPRCGSCPVRDCCGAKARGIEEILPRLPEKAEKKIVPCAVAMVFVPGGVLLRQRPMDGLLGGMWEFPVFENVHSAKELKAALADMGIAVRSVKRSESAEHVFTHLVWRMRGYLVEGVPAGMPSGCRAAGSALLGRVPMSSAMRMYRDIVYRELENRT